MQVRCRYGAGTVQVRWRYGAGIVQGTVQVQCRYGAGTVQVQCRYGAGTGAGTLLARQLVSRLEMQSPASRFSRPASRALAPASHLSPRALEPERGPQPEPEPELKGRYGVHTIQVWCRCCRHRHRAFSSSLFSLSSFSPFSCSSPSFLPSSFSYPSSPSSSHHPKKNIPRSSSSSQVPLGRKSTPKNSP